MDEEERDDNPCVGGCAAVELLYPKYVKFEAKLHSGVLSMCSPEYLRQQFRRHFRVLTTGEFMCYFQQLGTESQLDESMKWNEGFESWLAQNVAEQNMLRQKNLEFGFPAAVESAVAEITGIPL